MEEETITPVKVTGWDLSGPELKRGKQKDGQWEWVPVLPFVPEPIGVVTDHTGRLCAFQIAVRWSNGDVDEMTLPTAFLRSASPANFIGEACGLDFSPNQAKIIVQLLEQVYAGLSSAEPTPGTPHAEWSEGKLIVPGPSAPGLGQLERYGDVNGDEAEAQRAWDRIIRLGAEYPKIMIALGFAVGSLYIPVVPGTEMFVLHLTGESFSGKTQTSRIAMSILGDPAKIYATWDMSEKAPSRLLRLLGCLPAWFDEAAVSDKRGVELTRQLFALAQGRQRVTSDASSLGFVDGSNDRWTACVISTGESRLSVESGLTGLRRRVVELYRPFGPAQHESDEGNALALRYFGWPLQWIAANPQPETFSKDYHQIFQALSTESTSAQIEQAGAGAIAVCAAGFVTLCRAVGADWLHYGSVIENARTVFRKVLRAAAEEGADIGERGLRALIEAIKTSGKFYGPEEPFEPRPRWGVIFKAAGTVGILGESTLKEILSEYSNITDPQPVLERWGEMGRLINDRGKYTTSRNIYVPEVGTKRARMYLIRLEEEIVNGNG